MNQLVAFIINLTQIGKIMSQVHDSIVALTASVAALTATLVASNTKIDQLIVLAQDAGVPQEDIDAIVNAKTAIDTANTSVQDEDAKIDAALGANGTAAG